MLLFKKPSSLNLIFLNESELKVAENSYKKAEVKTVF